eukprot:5489746-Amphidinium_carterae.1
MTALHAKNPFPFRALGLPELRLLTLMLDNIAEERRGAQVGATTPVSWASTNRKDPIDFKQGSQQNFKNSSKHVNLITA